MTRSRELADLLTGGQTITTADNNPQLILKSTDADASSGPVLQLFRDSASPADEDVLGQLKYIGRNDAAEEIVYGKIDVVLKDASDGTEDAEMRFLVATAGDNPNALKLGPTETVFNDSSKDVNFRVESDGNANMLFVDGGNNRVGIGEASPATPLHISTGASTTNELRLTSNNTGSGAGDRGRIAVYSSRNDGTAYEAGRMEIDRSSGTADEAHIMFYTNGGSGVAERMRIDSDGHVGINDTNPSEAQLSVVTQQNESAAFLHCNASSMTGATVAVSSSRNTTGGTYSHLECAIHGVAVKMKVLDGGDVKNTNNSYGAISDQRMKENIVDAASQWDDIKALQVRKYNRIGETQKELGVIAQELEASGMGGLVEEGQWYDVDNNSDDETRKSVKYSVLYMKAVKALQEAMTRIETLETQNTTQATQIADLITRVTALEAG